MRSILIIGPLQISMNGLLIVEDSKYRFNQSSLVIILMTSSNAKFQFILKRKISSYLIPTYSRSIGVIIDLNFDK
jgi:hypothetical protein